MQKKVAVPKKLSKPVTGDKPRSVRVAALLNTGATLVAAVLVAAMSGPSKSPPFMSD